MLLTMWNSAAGGICLQDMQRGKLRPSPIQPWLHPTWSPLYTTSLWMADHLLPHFTMLPWCLPGQFCW
jgi:hypothetical protein